VKTKFCELIGIDYPIVCAGMGGVALANLACSGVRGGRARHDCAGGIFP
jgi:NAD(P)H-dependent flavin oxidoreductase YrpB (nitropropane dioxygenase family)